jgi:NAD(P)-dependent dehydrogenase (short-subunit alcohol dehydrogenase family)
LLGRSVLITGAARGMGRVAAMAKLLVGIGSA